MINICMVNFFMASMMNVGLPYLITEVLAFSVIDANRLYSYAEGISAIGGLIGGISTAIFEKKAADSKNR